MAFVSTNEAIKAGGAGPFERAQGKRARPPQNDEDKGKEGGLKPPLREGGPRVFH